MRVQELMIGDWARKRYIDCTTGMEVVKDFQVDQIQRAWHNENHDAWEKETGNMGKVEYLQAIPLTPEILAKNGYQKKGRYTSFFRDNSCMITIYHAPSVKIEGEVLPGPINIVLEGATFDVNMTIESVHQLQNVLRMCGLDEMADNFKI